MNFHLPFPGLHHSHQCCCRALSHPCLDSCGNSGSPAPPTSTHARTTREVFPETQTPSCPAPRPSRKPKPLHQSTLSTDLTCSLLSLDSCPDTLLHSSHTDPRAASHTRIGHPDSPLHSEGPSPSSAPEAPIHLPDPTPLPCPTHQGGCSFYRTPSWVSEPCASIHHTPQHAGSLAQ